MSWAFQSSSFSFIALAANVAVCFSQISFEIDRTSDVVGFQDFSSDHCLNLLWTLSPISKHTKKRYAHTWQYVRCEQLTSVISMILQLRNWASWHPRHIQVVLCVLQEMSGQLLHCHSECKGMLISAFFTYRISLPHDSRHILSMQHPVRPTTSSVKQPTLNISEPYSVIHHCCTITIVIPSIVLSCI